MRRFPIADKQNLIHSYSVRRKPFAYSEKSRCGNLIVDFIIEGLQSIECGIAVPWVMHHRRAGKSTGDLGRGGYLARDEINLFLDAVFFPSSAL
jgi:hypothetical protein